MKFQRIYISFILLSLIIQIGCSSSEQANPYNSKIFSNYWYAGKAEITSYKLDQARYGEIHSGYAVLIFVTEDFSRKKHVKLDYPIKDKEEAVKVMKLNFIKKFNTGIYRYSMMDSVFTPVNIKKYPFTLKETSSSQEWCGNTFMQLNLEDNKYQVRLYSYFESEGDREFTIDKAFLEDEIWARIRIDPSSLPIGEIKIIPGTMFARLTHNELKVENARGNLDEKPENENLMTYTLTYEEIGRSLVINFQKHFPYEIISWKETYKSGFGDNRRILTTKATKHRSILTDYWNQNKNIDVVVRNELGLDC